MWIHKQINSLDCYSYRFIGKLTVFFETSGVQLPESIGGLFHFHHSAFSVTLKSTVDNTLVKAEVLRCGNTFFSFLSSSKRFRLNLPYLEKTILSSLVYLVVQTGYDLKRSLRIHTKIIWFFHTYIWSFSRLLRKHVGLSDHYDIKFSQGKFTCSSGPQPIFSATGHPTDSIFWDKRKTTTHHGCTVPRHI